MNTLHTNRIRRDAPAPWPIQAGQPWPLHTVAATRSIERALLAELSSRALPPHGLMARAGQSAARLALALAPHARHYWVVCGPGNNGGDGLIAATRLHEAGHCVTAVRVGPAPRADSGAQYALSVARSAGVRVRQVEPDDVPDDLARDGLHLGPQDLVIDALLGLGARPFDVAPTTSGRAMAAWAHQLLGLPCTVLCLDVPSGLDADTGAASVPWPSQPPLSAPAGARHTLSLLTLKPGLFTGQGRDFSGQVWLDDLGWDWPQKACTETTRDLLPAPVAHLSAEPVYPRQPHASHKGLRGDVSVIGGQSIAVDGRGMEGAACLAAIAALHAGAGRVMVALLGPPSEGRSTLGFAPELMLRSPEAITLSEGVVVAGCGAGTSIMAWLDRVLSLSRQLVLDADAMNAIAKDPSLRALLRQRAARGLSSVITPHPLEAARLLGCSTPELQSDRLGSVQRLAEDLRCVVVLKGSGTVIGAPDQPLHINPTGNGLLSTAGTGDVLAGWIGAWMAQGLSAWDAALGACWRHGQLADAWHGSGGARTMSAASQADERGATATRDRPRALTASGLARCASPPFCA